MVPVRDALRRGFRNLLGGAEPAKRPVATAVSPAPLPAASPSAFANFARQAATSGVSTAATFRKSADDEEEHEDVDHSSADRVMGALVHDGQLRVSPAGASFWGPIDNESARARASGKKLAIDQDECIACGTCVEHVDTVYELPDGEKARVISQDGPMDRVQDAIDCCPVTCISWND